MAPDSSWLCIHNFDTLSGEYLKSAKSLALFHYGHHTKLPNVLATVSVGENTPLFRLLSTGASEESLPDLCVDECVNLLSMLLLMSW
jgi:hypothetical protein